MPEGALRGYSLSWASLIHEREEKEIESESVRETPAWLAVHCLPVVEGSSSSRGGTGKEKGKFEKMDEGMEGG